MKVFLCICLHPRTLYPLYPCKSFDLAMVFNLLQYTISISVFLVLGVLGWILSTLDASLTEGGVEHHGGGGAGARNINFKISRNGLRHRKPM